MLPPLKPKPALIWIGWLLIMIANPFQILPLISLLQSPIDPSLLSSHAASKYNDIAPAVERLNGASSYDWNLPNGNIHFHTPLLLNADLGDSKTELLTLSNPVFLGSGGSGAVFSFTTNTPNKNIPTNNLAIKVSWKASRSTVENECSILQTLGRQNVPHIEQCISQTPYSEDRVMIALIPVASSKRTSSVSDLSVLAQENAVRQVIETMVAMLLANVITVDVQPLISETGEVLFIDFTEAKTLSVPVSSSELTGVVGFCNEMIALIPESLRENANTYLKMMLKDLNGSGMMLQSEVYDVLESIWLG